MKTNQSKEDYLETILLISKEKKDVHQIDVARRLNVSQPAVQKALRLLIADELIVMEGLHIFLTQKGEEYAEQIYEKHCVLYKFLIKLGVDCQTANEDACKLEHVLSEQTYQAIKEFLNKK